jgi:predicted glycosyltransferase
MKRLMFYCQHILGIGHLIRSMEIVKGLTPDFEICFINGGEVIQDFPIPPHVTMVNLPAIKTDSEFRELYVPEGFETAESLMEIRKQQMLDEVERFRPDILMVELFPFGRRRFSTELIPVIEAAKAINTKVVCSLRDIVVTKQDRTRHEEKICQLMNQYFDLLLVHGDPQFMPLETSFSRIQDLHCPVYYTGYVTQQLPVADLQSVEPDLEDQQVHDSQPSIVVSVGGGRFGHELLDCVSLTSAILEVQIPHHIHMFTGPFSPDPVFERMQAMANQRKNLTVKRYTPHLIDYMRHADLSISMAGYNTTMNVLVTGVRSMLLPFTGNDDQEQRMRCERLQELGIVSVIEPANLTPEYFAQQIITCLQQTPQPMHFDMQGVEKTAKYLHLLANDADL